MASSATALLLSHWSAAVFAAANARSNELLSPVAPRRNPPIIDSMFQRKKRRRDSEWEILSLNSHSRVPDGAGRLARSIAGAMAAALLCSGARVSWAEVYGGKSDLAPAYQCEDVAGYYASLEEFDGAALMERLSAIVSPHRALTYREVWDALKILDAADPDDPENSSDVIEIYSLRSVPKTMAGKSQGWNREHLWPRSYGLIDKSSFTDLHNLRPADVNVNSSRGNKYYGECVSESAACIRPANSEAAPDTETDPRKWAPPFQVRGDVARSLMYMAVSYGMYQPGVGPHLKLSDSPTIKNREMGLLSTLLKWNEEDPPSKAEKLRNERVCRLYQHNRNPFVDHPEYANRIWKQTLIKAFPNYLSSKAWINEFHYDNKGKDENEFVEIVVDSSTDARTLMLLLYNGRTGKVYKSLDLGDGKVFTVSETGSRLLVYTTYVKLQNGPSDGMTLVSLGDESRPTVIEFISYEGTLIAADGPARGVESIDVNVEETEASSQHDSIGLTETPEGELKWTQFKGTATPGKPNIMQSPQA